MSNIAVDTLLKRRKELDIERSKMWENWCKEINAIDAAIFELTGKTHAEVAEIYHYDDEAPDYIKMSQEEI
jgi:hypothetical protein